jgi:tetratricopeptide (TPR) repeat protein
MEYPVVAKGSTSRLRQMLREAEGYLELGLAQQSLDALARLGDPAGYGPHALYLMGEALKAQERYHEALGPLTRAAEGDPENLLIWLALGWCHKRTSRLDLAIQDMQFALRADPSEPLLHYNLACYLSLAGQKDRAITHLSKALAMDTHYRTMADAEPDFDPIRSDPEFQALTGVAA